MRLLPVIFVQNTEASIEFYSALGLELGYRTDAGDWAELPASGGMLALHSHASADTGQDPRAVELCFAADEPLEVTVERLTKAGFRGGTIVEETFGRSLRTEDPDGRPIQINEDPEVCA